MLKVKVREGTLDIDEEKLTVKSSLKAGLFGFVFSRLANIFGKIDDSIPLKDISMVVFESGIPEKMCPHILVYYGKKTRMIEFCVEKEGRSKAKSDLRKALDYLEKKGIELGIVFEA